VVFGDPIDGQFTLLLGSGGHWHPVDPGALPAAAAGEAGFAASGSCVAVQGSDRAWIGTGGSRARVLATADGGRSWSVTATPLRCGRPSAGIFSIAFADARHGVVVGGDYRDPDSTDGNAARTADGGLTWQLPEVPPHGYRSAVAPVPGSGGGAWVAVGSDGADYSTDGGRSWVAIAGAAYHALAFAAGASSGWAVGADGRIARLEW